MAVGGVLVRQLGTNAGITQVGPDAAGGVLTSNGAGALPTFQTPGSGPVASAFPLIITSDFAVAANTGVVVPESFEIDAGVIMEIGAGARLEVTGPVIGPVPAWVLIETQSPVTGTSVTFSSLGSYTHLDVIWNGRGDQAATSTNLTIQFNSDSGSNYDRQLMTASAAAATASESLGQTSAAIGSLAAGTAPVGVAGAGSLRLFDYRNSAFHKIGVSSDGLTRGTSSGDIFVRQFTVKWRSTAPMTSFTIALASGSFVTGTKFSLYGVL